MLHMLRCSACLSTGWTHNLPSSVARSWRQISPTRSWSTGEFDTLSSSLCTIIHHLITCDMLRWIAMNCDMFQSQLMSWTLESLAIVSADPLSLAAVTALIMLFRKPVLSRVLVPHGGHRSIWASNIDNQTLSSIKYHQKYSSHQKQKNRNKQVYDIDFWISQMCNFCVSKFLFPPAMVVPPGDSTAFLSCAGCLRDQCHQPFPLDVSVKIISQKMIGNFLLRSLSPCSVILAEPKTVCAASRKATSRGKPFFTWDSPVFYSPIELWLNREMDLQPLHTLQSCFRSIKSWPQTAATLENVISPGAPNSAIRHWFDHHVPWHC